MIEHSPESALISHRQPQDKVKKLISAASSHPLGLDFLINGDLSSVAAMFEAHAFTIEAAREFLEEEGDGVAKPSHSV